MRTFGFTVKKQRKRRTSVNRGFLVLSILAFLLFSLVTRLQQTVLASTPQTIFDQDIQQLALYLEPYDPRASSVLLSLQRIIAGYTQTNFLKTYEGDIANLLQYLSNSPEKFSQLGIQSYMPTISLLAQASAYKSDILSLLGSEKPQTYLVILQNAAEKRPNGGFFGSFVKVTIADAKITDLQFIDSYVPGIIRPDVSLEAPARSTPFLSGDQHITFLASNKFGFTNMDGANIKNLYDRTYGDDIRGIIFINSKIFSDLLPGFQEKLWEWQFKNASIDLIRGQALPNKKELYFNDVKAFLQTHQQMLIKAVAKYMTTIQKNRLVQSYFVRTSKDFTNFLQQQKFETVFSTGNMYLWDYNSSYNKIDTFVQKSVSIMDAQGNIVKDETQDVVSLQDLAPGTYTVHIQYSLNIPDSYRDYIMGLAKKFGIELHVREKHILALYPERTTRGVVYLAPNIDVLSIDGPVKNSTTFDTPFSHNAFYVLENTENNTIKDVVVTIKIN